MSLLLEEKLTDALQAGHTRDQGLTGSDEPRRNEVKHQLSEKEVQKARTSSKVLIDGGDLPADLLARIFGRLPTADLLGCAAVCRHWQQVVRDLTVNTFTFKLNFDCPFCHAEVSDNHKSNLQRSSEWQMAGLHTPSANLRVIGTASALILVCGATLAYEHCSKIDAHSCVCFLALITA